MSALFLILSYCSKESSYMHISTYCSTVLVNFSQNNRRMYQNINLRYLRPCGRPCQNQAPNYHLWHQQSPVNVSVLLFTGRIKTCISLCKIQYRFSRYLITKNLVCCCRKYKSGGRTNAFAEYLNSDHLWLNKARNVKVTQWAL